MIKGADSASLGGAFGPIDFTRKRPYFYKVLYASVRWLEDLSRIDQPEHPTAMYATSQRSMIRHRISYGFIPILIVPDLIFIVPPSRSSTLENPLTFTC